MSKVNYMEEHLNWYPLSRLKYIKEKICNQKKKDRFDWERLWLNETDKLQKNIQSKVMFSCSAIMIKIWNNFLYSCKAQYVF